MSSSIFRNALSSLGLVAVLLVPAGCTTMREAPAKSVRTLASVPSGLTVLNPKQGLYVAGQPGVEDWQAIAASGVRTIVNLRTADEMKTRDERAEVDDAGMHYVELPIAGVAGITADNASLLSALLAEAEGPVLVHCASANRAGALLAVASMQQGMAIEPALAFGRESGMKSTEVRTREVIEELRAATCAAAAGDASVGRCP
ncbi:MAG: hypothetical protein HOP03_12450 [Lysobacter sp.]|nr:hypothetical protein [Lysobacter sp.]